MKAKSGSAPCALLLAIAISLPVAADQRHVPTGGGDRESVVAQTSTVDMSTVTTGGRSEVRIRITASNDTHNTVRVTRNQHVRLEVLTDQPSELHLHGYDLVGHSSATQPAVFVFKAVHTGRFAIVTHSHAGKGLLQGPERAVVYLEVRSE